MQILYQTSDKSTFGFSNGKLMTFDASLQFITDRTQRDVAYVQQLASKLIAGTATDFEKAEWNSILLKGAYNYTDLNRVTAIMDFLKSQLESYGYTVRGYQKVKIESPKPDTSIKLPDGYVRVEYIESSGTQRIETDYYPNQDTRVVMDMHVLDTHTSGTDYYLSAVNIGSSAGYWTMRLNANVDGYAARYPGNALKAVAHSGNLFGRHIFDQNRNTVQIDDAAVTTFTASTWTSTRTLPIFCYRNTDTGYTDYTNARLYSCQIYDNDVLVRDYIPCINPSGDIGLYDLVSKTFFGNAGTGTFTAGSVVESVATYSVSSTSENIELPPRYQWQEDDVPTYEQITTYVANVDVLRRVLPVLGNTPDTPVVKTTITLQEANNIEQILKDINIQLVTLASTFIACGEALCGGENL